MENISFEDFKKVDLRIAKILEVKKVEESHKLLKIKVSVGEDVERNVVSGVAEYYTPEELIGKEVVIVFNLEPKTIFGIESCGMLLFSKKEDKLVALIPEEEVNPGSIIS